MNLDCLTNESLFAATNELFEQLGVKLNSNTANSLNTKNVLNDNFKANAPFTSIKKLYFAGVIDDSVFNSSGTTLSYEAAIEIANQQKYNGLALFAAELNKTPARSEIAELTRAFNRLSTAMPTALLLRYNDKISIAISERFKYLQEWREGEKIGKVIILRDINTQKPHAGHVRILRDLAGHNAQNFDELHKKWLDVLDVNILNKKFYGELSNWYFWAIQNVKFPDDIENDEEVRNSTNLIRLITRIIFIWFIKEKGLVPENLFDESELQAILKDFNKQGKGYYYNAILQNLFFGTLNQKTDDRKFAKDSDFLSNRNEYGVKGLYRYANMFKIENEKDICELFKDIPFLNGGLFDCLDKEDEDKKVKYIDGFSRNKNKIAKVPDFLFFGDEQDFDLNQFYDTKSKNYKVKGLIKILNSYKFTIAENTPQEEDVALDPELLGKVFENLLASYNPETKTTARKQTGSFYTPREIVDYMVNESLTAYLRDKVGEDWESNKKTISALNDIKILDPACGSGAFPMGALHKMVEILQKLDPNNKQWRKLQEEKAVTETKDAFKIENQQERDERLKEISDVFENNASDYGRKLYLIENCIFGVDIQPIAVQISKLRFFISLIIDQDIDKTKDNFGVRPLPNLETKFVAANTLIGLATENTLFRTPEIVRMENDLKQVRKEYFTASTRSKKIKLQEKDKELRKKLSEELKTLGFGDESATRIANFDIYNQNIHAEWFDAAWMFGLSKEIPSLNHTDSNGYFNIVIGNPPYVQLQKNGGELSKRYGPQKEGRQIIPSPYKTFDSMGDIYSLFYECGCQLLKSLGWLCFITSNKWMRAGYGENTRKFLSENTNPKLLIDFAGVKVFESATVDTNILMFSKDKNQQQTQACIVKKEGIKELSVYINQSSSVCGFGSGPGGSGDSWVVLSPIEQRIKAKVEAVGVPLKDWDINIYRGILTGYNDAFIIDGRKRDELISKDPKSDSIIRPILRGRDIRRYGYQFSDLYLITTFPSLKIDIDAYPAVKRHLLSFGYDRLKQTGEAGARKKTNHKWFETQDSIGYWEDFYRQKIVWGNLNLTAAYSFAPEGMFVNAPCPLIVPASAYLLAVLNSKLADYYIKSLGVTRSGGYFEYKPMFIEKLPIPLPCDEMCQKIDNFLQTKEYDKIDNIIYNLYNLSKDEISFINSQ
jgi:23S rRNA G2445 N2-methylase RlmL